MKKVAVIPTLLTLCNAVCGFASIAVASKIPGTIAVAGQIRTDEVQAQIDWLFTVSGWLIVAAMIFDTLDGYVARMSRTTSLFGLQLDSLCDAISFGLAPAFLLLQLGPGWDQVRLHQVLAIIATLYMVCTLLRLARFNIETAPDPLGIKRFRGLPSPAAAGCIASLAILRVEAGKKFPGLAGENFRLGLEIGSALGALCVSLLMVSRLPYPHLTKQLLRGRRSLAYLVQIILALFVLVLFKEFALGLVFWIYAIFSPLRSIGKWGRGGTSQSDPARNSPDRPQQPRVPRVFPSA